MNQDYTSYEGRGRVSIIAIVVIVIFGLCFFAAFVYTYAQYSNLQNTILGQTPTSPTSSACSTRPECVSITSQYATLFNHADNGGFFGPACVSDTLLGRVLAVPGITDPTWMPTTLGRVGMGQRIAFAISAGNLEKMLPMGNRDATAIVRSLGFGAQYVCGTASKNYTDCQYRLILWNAPCLQNRPAATQGYWDNLEWFFRNYIYGDKTPSLTAAIAQFKAADNLFSNITGCDATFTPNNYWNPTAQQAAGCSSDFITQMAYFNRVSCNGTNASSPYYTPGSGCLPENRFLALTSPTANQLRAYLMQNEAFNPFYTGYGYTSNDFYTADQEEFWYPNDYISNLQNALVIPFYNGSIGQK